ncbi:DNA mismatch repair protein MutS [Rhodococcus sp. ARC_M8]|uniref:DNA mismatch repair protein MutS n=1 Tax=Rhodococcus qingshengii JCM 15477 TaxID=1303681 RepID=A0AB38RPP4_RHOSG|nr:MULTISPECIES: DNA mismatch repair protein MutS [Rhodococcus]MCJ0948930.1 DNA mismatch repair protein MutS [Rhodococcus sp. ARC_M8]UPU47105.1 DNA mismatch repair protein MutS [Rhodococcus qingshengii JCM 15477]
MNVRPPLPMHNVDAIHRTYAPDDDAAAMTAESFRSILFENPATAPPLETNPPEFFGDLNLEQVVTSIVAGHEEYDLEQFFHTALTDTAAITYRHEVFRDVQMEEVRSAVDEFAAGMHEMRTHLARARKRYYPREQQAWFLMAVRVFAVATTRLSDNLTVLSLRSSGLRRFRDYLADYLQGPEFSTLRGDLDNVERALSGIRYCLIIKGDRITVRRYDGESDYSTEVERTFEKFKQGEVREHHLRNTAGWGLNHVEAHVLDLLARLHPREFAELNQFCQHNRGFLDRVIDDFDREIQFYLVYLDYLDRFEHAGLQFCYPHVTDRSHEVSAFDTFDIALAERLVPERAVVCNDFALTGRERVIVVSGPNQGGKTTFARTFGQMHYLGRLGCLVPGHRARLHLYDHLFTHFEREEVITNLSGKLQDELERIHDILDQATSESIVIMNETFTSTTVKDARLLGGAVLNRIIDRGMLGVYVTFVDELSRLNEATVSMVAAVDPDDPAHRTFTLVRQRADGLAYALTLAEKYRLTYQQVKERRS